MANILTIIIKPPGAGGVTIEPKTYSYAGPGKVSFPTVTDVTLTITPFPGGGTFDHWEGAVSGTAMSVSLHLDSDKEVIAVFAVDGEIPTYKLSTAVIGNGSVAPSQGDYAEGSQIIIIAQPASGNVFQSWSGDLSGTSPVPGMPNNLIVPMDRDRHIIAQFKAGAPPTQPMNYIALTVSPSTAFGYITSSPTPSDAEENRVYYPDGTIVTLSAHPQPGYKFVRWSGDFEGSGSTSLTLQLYMDTNYFVTAEFDSTAPPPPLGEAEFQNLTCSYKQT